MTKRDILTALNSQELVDVTFGEETITVEDMVDFIEKSIAQLDARTAKAKEKAAEKKAAGDALKARIREVLSEDPMTVAEIVEALDDEEVTNAKVIARLTQLGKAGEVFKSDRKVDGRTLKIYATVPFEEPEVDANDLVDPDADATEE